MKDFCVEVKCPEVFAMLEGLAFKAGWVWRVDATKPHTWFYGSPVMLFIGGQFMESWSPDGQSFVNFKKGTGEQLTIEQTIERLKRPVEKPIIIGGHEAKFPGDGSVIIGGTTVTAEQADEIEKRRKMKSDGWRYFVNSSGVLLKYLASEGDRAAVRGFGLAMNGWFGNNYNLSEYQGTDRNEITEAEARDKFPAAFTEAQ